MTPVQPLVDTVDTSVDTFMNASEANHQNGAQLFRPETFPLDAAQTISQ